MAFADLLLARNVIVQGITGTHGSFHTKAMCAAGTRIVGGTSPNKAGETVHGVPVFSTVQEIIDVGVPVDTSIIFVPAAFAHNACREAITAGVKLLIIITEGIPLHDMLRIRHYADERGAVIVGPNCPGIFIPSLHKLGIIPAAMGLAGSVGIVSRSGTLTYEAMAGLTAAGVGQRYIIGIGGDAIKGIDFVDCLELFELDNQVDRIVLIGEIGGHGEHKAADYIASHVTKPVYAYIAGHQAPIGVQLGHAGAILNETDESALEKTMALRKSGAVTADNISSLVTLVAEHGYRKKI